MPKKKSGKSSRNNFSPLKPTFNKLVLATLALQVILLVSIFFVVNILIDNNKIYEQSFNSEFYKDTNDSLYTNMKIGSTNYGSKVTQWTELGLQVPVNYQNGNLYATGDFDPKQDNLVSEYLFSNDAARYYYNNKYYRNIEGYWNEIVPVMQACSRVFIAIPTGNSIFYDDYEFLFNKKLSDGRELDFYKNSICSIEEPDPYIEQLMQIDSI